MIPHKRTLQSSMTAKILVIALLTFLLSIGLLAIFIIGQEREYRAEEAKREIAEKWGQEQIIGGPLLAIPQEIRNSQGTIQKEILFVLPENLEVSSEVSPEVRSRGIFESILYSSENTLKAQFTAEQLNDLAGQYPTLLWDQAEISYAISDFQGLQESLKVQINDQEQALTPGTGINKHFYQGVSSKLDLRTRRDLELSLQLKLQGSQALSILPVGQQVQLSMNSEWPSPSFSGNILPKDYELSEQGFSANWETNYFSGNLAPSWLEGENNYSQMGSLLREQSFGTEFILPADGYQQHTRSLKYGLLFILLTFSVYFLFEILGKLLLHPLNYLLIGSSMVVFYLLLLSFTEHMSFATAYLIASAATISLIAYYSSALLRSKTRTAMITAFMTFIYGFLYVLLQLEDYALLMGSLVVFTVLALLMILTRKINWYDFHQEAESL